MDSFFKIAAVDINSKCNNISPFNYSDMNRKQDPKTGRVFTQEDTNQAWATFMKITNSTESRAIPCCNPEIKLSDVNPDIYNIFQDKYPYVRPIVRNGDLVEIQLSKTAKAGEAGWELMTPYIMCKLSYALTTPGYIQKSTDADDVWVVGVNGMLLDCFTTNCRDSSSIDNLFGTSRKDPEYTYIDDATVARAMADGDIKTVRDYIFKFNNTNQVLTHDDYGNRLVHLVAMNYRPKIFELLVAVKANFNVRNAKGNTPIHLAVQSGNMNCIEELLKLSGQTIEVNAKNMSGQTPLMLALAYQPKPDPKSGIIPKTELQMPMTLVRYLYNHGANVLDKDALGNNMIHIILLNMSIESEKVAAIKFMLSKGVSADQKNNAGITPLMLAAELIKASGADNLLPPEQTINILPEEDEDTTKEGFWADQKLLPSAMINSVNQHLNTVNGTNSKNGTNNYNIINQPNLPPADNQGVNEIDATRLTKKQIDLIEIRTLLFNDIIRNNPTKYNKFISVRDIPAGAPVEILDHNCVSATGELISDRIDTAEQCAEQPNGHWVPVKNPSTLVKLDLLPESKRIIDAIPDDKLYYAKDRPSEDAVPLPAEIQELNSEARTQLGNPTSNNSNTSNSNSKTSNNNSVKEGFFPALLPFLAGSGHHISATAGFIGAHATGFLADLTGDYISKSITTEPPIDPDNLSSQRRPTATTLTTTSNYQGRNTYPSSTNSLITAATVNNKHQSLEHPPVIQESAANKEAFRANRLELSETGMRRGVQYFLADNWMMLLIFILLAIILVVYVSRSGKDRKH